MQVKVLLIDDAVEIRSLVRIALELDGRFEVVGEGGDGIEATALAEELQPDIILLDLAMPRMDGLTAIPEIRRVCPGARILAYTGFSGGPLADQVITLCGDAYLEKGAGPEVVADALYLVATSPPKSVVL